jgi:hypothetical protein
MVVVNAWRATSRGPASLSKSTPTAYASRERRWTAPASRSRPQRRLGAPITHEMSAARVRRNIGLPIRACESAMVDIDWRSGLSRDFEKGSAIAARLALPR